MFDYNDATPNPNECAYFLGATIFLLPFRILRCKFRGHRMEDFNGTQYCPCCGLNEDDVKNGLIQSFLELNWKEKSIFFILPFLMTYAWVIEPFKKQSPIRVRVQRLFKKPCLKKKICQMCYCREKRTWGYENNGLWNLGAVRCIATKGQHSIDEIPPGCYYALENLLLTQKAIPKDDTIKT